MSLKVWLPLNGNTKDQGISRSSIINSGATFVSTGKVTSKCLNIPATQNKGLEIGTDILSGKSECTIAFWVYRNSSTTSYPFIFENNAYWQLVMSSSTIYLRDTNTGPQGTRKTISITIDPTTWYHICLTYKSGTLTLYINGSLTQSVTSGDNGRLNPMNHYYIGEDPLNGGSYYGNCQINDFRIYDNALSADEVREVSLSKILHYTLGSSLYNSPKKSYDISGFKNNGTINGDIKSLINRCVYKNSISFSDTNYISADNAETDKAVSASICAYIGSAIPTTNAVLFADAKSKLALGFTNNGTLFITSCNGTSRALAPTTNVKLNSWNHFVVSYNGSNNILYVNGVDQTMSGSNYWTHSTNNLMVGKRSSGNSFNGYLTDFRLYAAELQKKDAERLYKQFDNRPNYLCFTAVGVASTVKLTNYGTNAPIVYYSFDADTWTQWDYNAISLQPGLSVYIYGNNPSGFSTSTSNFTKFVMTGKIAASGNIQSLISKDMPNTIPVSYCYFDLFINCASLIQAPDLPATTLTSYCYYYMFYNCTSLKTAPELPATTLKTYCYYYMFRGCTALVNAPALPATTLATYCYQSMFYGCTALVNAPALPATTLTNYCYTGMFRECTNLSRVVCKATDIPAAFCLENWLNGVSATGDFYKVSTVTYPDGASGIPSGWTVHTIA